MSVPGRHGVSLVCGACGKSSRVAPTAGSRRAPPAPPRDFPPARHPENGGRGPGGVCCLPDAGQRPVSVSQEGKQCREKLEG